METMQLRRGENSKAKKSSSASKSTSSKNPEWLCENSAQNAHICDEFIGANKADESAAAVTFNSCDGDSEGVFASRNRIEALSGLASALRVSPSISSDDTPDDGFERITDPINLERGRPELQNPEIYDVSLGNKIHLDGFNASGLQDGRMNPPQPLPPHPISPNSPTSSRPSQSSWKKGMLLGKGTLGLVYHGFCTKSGQMFAIKEVPVIYKDSPTNESLRQLIQEINLLGQLSHPNIVQYCGSKLVDNILSIYLEYVMGESIYMLLLNYGSFEEPLIKKFTIQILTGLAYLHGKNIVHGDIKGANILVNYYGEAKIADFGIAKHISSDALVRSPRGNPYWTAPEVIMNKNEYNLSVDIWSIGCTILEMATSKPPWSRFEWMAARHEILFGKDIPDIPDHLSSEAKSFVMSCLQRDPSNRPTAAQLMKHPFLHDQDAKNLQN